MVTVDYRTPVGGGAEYLTRARDSFLQIHHHHLHQHGGGLLPVARIPPALALVVLATVAQVPAGGAELLVNRKVQTGGGALDQQRPFPGL